MTTLRYRILGPLSVTGDEQTVAITAGRDRIVLAMLLLHPGRIVGWGELAEAVWGAEPPATVRGQLQTCVSRLRRALPDAILTDRAGYGIQVERGELDAQVFAGLVDEARAAGDPEEARRAYRQGLDLWRGRACAEIDAPAVRRLAASLEELRAAAIEDWVSLELAAGTDRDLLGELASLVEQYPLRERLRGQFMLALCRAGRQADALAEFRRTRETLVEELGIEPGKELQDLHQEILSGRVPEPRRPEGRAVEQVRCLPRTVRDFTGREWLVERLLGEMSGVLVIDGMAGSGKTTLALHLAALVGDRYPDAHLFVDLQGHSAEEPVEPGAALLVLLRQLGLSAETIPADLVGRVALWRTELARRRALVVLDNAASSAQVADLLPTSAGSLALVTSRRRLAGLDGVQPEPLPLLDTDESIALLTRIVGERVVAEPEAAAEVVRRCGGLPLAIRLAGARLAHRPRWRVADLVRRLGEAVLPELAVEDRTVGNAFALSYGQLGAEAQRLFGKLGLYPGATVDAPAAAALDDLDLDQAGELLDELVDVHLLEEPEPGVYRMHDLLREFAAALADGLSAQERSRALLSVLNLETFALAASVTRSYAPRLQYDLKGLTALRPELVAAIADPAARLERYRPDLGSFLEAAVRSGHPAYAWWIPRAAWYLLFYRGYHQDVIVLHERGFAVAREQGDDDGVALSANGVASFHYRNGDYRKAREYLEIYIRIRERQGDATMVAWALGNLASILVATSQFTEGIEMARRSLRANSATAPLASLTQLSVAYQKLGRYREALRIDRLRLIEAAGGREIHQKAGCLLQIQRSKRRLGLITPQVAKRYVEVALAMFIREGLVLLEAEARTDLGVLLAELGDCEAALAEHRRAVEIVEWAGEARYAAEFVHDYGITLRRSGDVPGALAQFERSLRIAHTAQQPYSVGRALAGIADCVEDEDPERAQRLRAEALDLFEQLGVPERFALERRRG
ncbi:BTAD domain-containing putative transcriptional regulator [Actinoplanes sp. NPDC024001]|uniref:AfsR/SARP family transcriptional regulator n=1 Tax=Actinoplanes sp. NPDC024001 TaxID=3154598 RepID=UPI0033CDED96